MRHAAVAFLVLFLASCSTTPVDIMDSAETVPQRAGATYGLWVIAQETAADIVVLPETPDSVVFAIADAEARVKPMVDAMRETYLAYKLKRDEVDALVEAGDPIAGTTLQELRDLLELLTQQVNRTEPEVNSFDSLVNSS